jgi:Ca2+-binding EF-hand superfamily protein
MGKQQSKLSLEQHSHLQQQTYFDSAEIKQWHRSWIKDSPSGVMTREEFQRIYCEMFPFGDSSAFSDLVFTIFDKDQNGVLDFSEFLLALSAIGRGGLDEKLEWTFQLYDLNHDGYISRAEMLRIVDAIYRMVGDSVSMKEDENTPEKRVEKIFAIMDKDLDGRLSKQEFKEGGKDPAIRNTLCIYDHFV